MNAYLRFCIDAEYALCYGGGSHDQFGALYATLDGWIAREATSFAVDSPGGFEAALARVIASLGGSVGLLGFGEALHGGEDTLLLRNRLFQYLVKAHGYAGRWRHA